MQDESRKACEIPLKINTAPALTAAETRQLLGSTPIQRLPGRNHTKADILVYQRGSRKIAVKDYSPRPFVLRSTVGRFLLRREVRAYLAIGGLDGVPRFLGRLGPYTLATEWLDGRPLAQVDREEMDERVWPRLRALVDDLHARGVALGDLHRRDVLLGSDGAVYVIDFATALALGSRPGPLRRYLFRRWRDLDRVAVARMEARFTGGDSAAAIAAVGQRAAVWYRRRRVAKRWFDRLRGRA